MFEIQRKTRYRSSEDLEKKDQYQLLLQNVETTRRKFGDTIRKLPFGARSFQPVQGSVNGKKGSAVTEAVI